MHLRKHEREKNHLVPLFTHVTIRFPATYSSVLTPMKYAHIITNIVLCPKLQAFLHSSVSFFISKVTDIFYISHNKDLNSFICFITLKF